METPSPSYIITRAALFIALLVAVLFGVSFVKKKQRQSAIVADLTSITSDSTFFKQFYAEDARKSLIRAVGLLAEANSLGLDPDHAIDRALGIKSKFFENDADHDEPPVREQIIRTCLHGNYQNFIKLGYKADFHTLAAMKDGELPPIPSGPESGRKPEVVTLIDPALSPGIEKVLANLEIQPPRPDDWKPNDIQIATAKQLVRDLSYGRYIEEPARDRMLDGLSGKPPEDESP